jgi:hypothetical protein
MSLPSQTAHLMNSGLIGPDGAYLVQVSDGAELVIGELDREAPELNVALNLARPWRASAMEGEIYTSRRVTDTRSADRTCW